VDSAGINFRNALIDLSTESRRHFVYNDVDIPGLIASVARESRDASNERLLLYEKGRWLVRRTSELDGARFTPRSTDGIYELLL